MSRARGDVSRDARTKAPTAVFLHVPKTAGMTVRQIIERNFPRRERHLLPLPPQSVRPRLETNGASIEDSAPGPEATPDTEIQKLARLPEEKRRRLRIVYGHTIFGVHEVLPRPATYVTMLREPIARVISTYHYLRRRQDHWLHDEATKLSLEEFVRVWIARTDNLQTRMISGEFTNPDPCSEATLELAKRNVDEHFVALGLTERFDESVLLWGRVLGWRKLHYVPRNVTRRDTTASVPSDVARVIQETNELDAELYRFVTKRFEEQLEQHSVHESDVARFRRRNALFQRVYPARLKPFLRRVKRAVLPR